jgi:hypothetical protein
MRMLTIFVLAISGMVHGAEEPPRVQFSRDVLPILSENCFQCHGPDENARKAHLRLDMPGCLKAESKSGLAIIAPKQASQSELIARVMSTEPAERMPPPKSTHKLTPTQKQVLRRWIDEGAVWGKHWAYETPVRPAFPVVDQKQWQRNGLDSFVLHRLEREGLAPSPEASRETLIRRVTLDLTGVPPSPDEVTSFVQDRSPTAYTKVVDRLLASPRFGERMAMPWLDDARYADTNGYQNDFARTMWPWRDWVIRAFNANKPFDQFVVEQIAGDLLPGATVEQKIATGFNRNNRAVTEAGSIEDEWRVENGVDRVETTATVFLGLTVGCARCHDHKFDPISQKDFYRFFAFFNSANIQGVYTEQRGNTGPIVTVPTAEDTRRLRQFDREIGTSEQALRQQEAALNAAQQRWEKQLAGHAPAVPADAAFACPLNGDEHFVLSGGYLGHARFQGSNPAVWTSGPSAKALQLDGKPDSFLDTGSAFGFERGEPISYGGWVKFKGNGAVLSKMDDAKSFRGFDLLIHDGKIAIHLVNEWPGNAIKVESQEVLPKDSWTHLLVTYSGSSKASGITLYIDGRKAKLDVKEDRLSGSIATAQPLRIGKRSASSSLMGELADIRFYSRKLTGAEAESLALAPVFHVLATPAEARTKRQADFLARVYRAKFATAYLATEVKLAKLRLERAEYAKKVPSVMVMEELKTPRETFVLKRGRYEMPDKNQKVEPAAPSCLTPMPPGAGKNRLGLARWLVDPDNPLTARVTVNRYWQQYFGNGLVKTAENFGVQGELPSHPELLDWLATEFIRDSWDIKRLQKLIVSSATYRQTSRVSAGQAQLDPENRLLSRGPRFRLPAEALRDNALAISGLLVDRLGGQSIKPYQPAGLWEELAGGAGEAPYVQDKDANLYRRSLYIYRKRTVPNPSMATFDAPSGEICQVKRARTNTPLQALELLNDVTYVEAARQLAQLMISEGGKTDASRIAFGFRRATARTLGSAELQVLTKALDRYRKQFQSDPQSAARLIRHGDSKIDNTVDPVELAAYLATASVILNLDETVTKE